MSQFHWINPPAVWREENQQLSVVTDQNTDFWRETRYGFTRFSGHFTAARRKGILPFRRAFAPISIRSTIRRALCCWPMSNSGLRRD